MGSSLKLMMGLVACLCVSGLAKDREESCRVSSVLSGELEEGLGEYGSDADDDSETVRFTIKRDKLVYLGIGQSSWSPAADTKLSFSESKGVLELVASDTDGSGHNVKVLVYPSKRGTVLYAPSAKGELDQIANFDCSSTAIVEKASVGDGNVKKLTTAEVKKLNKTFRTRLNEVDLAFEAGDGYYDLKSSAIYRVTEKGSAAVTGYLLVGVLQPTEEKETVEGVVRFDRNALRLGELELNE